MSKAETKVKGAVGRPKKSPSIPYSQFRGVGTAANRITPTQGGIIEWTYTEISNFQKIMKTFKSCDVSFIYLYFLKSEIIIKGITNPYNKSTKQSRLLRFSIDPSDTLSYYVKTPHRFKISMAEWETPLQDMDEACNKFSIIYIGGDNFSISVANSAVVCGISTPVIVETMEVDELAKYDETISNSLSRYAAKIINIKSGNMKSLLGKNSRRNCQKSTFKLQGTICEFNFELITDKHQVINFDVFTEAAAKNLIKLSADSKTGSKDKFYVINSSTDFFQINFPNIEIYKFLLHLKSDAMEIYFSPGCAIARVLKPRVFTTDTPGNHSSFIYYIPIETTEPR